MDILSLTTTQAIRAVLGVSQESDELNDAVFTDIGIEDELELSFSDWLPVPYTQIVSSGPATALQALRVCAKYAGALILLPSLQNAVSIRQSDGQNEFQRHPRDLTALKKSLEEALGRYKSVVLSEVDPVTVAPTSPTWFGKASPSFDPVTG